MFEINNGVVKIDGSNGKYDARVTDPSVRYGRNAVENYYSYLEKPIVEDTSVGAPNIDFKTNPMVSELSEHRLEQFINENDVYLKALPPLKYEYRYMPKGSVDTKAVLAAAYEELGDEERSVEELDANFAPDNNFTSKAMDINNDGKIDAAEYGTSILAADMLSKSSTPDFKNIDGTINNKGFNAVLAYAQKSNIAAATKLYSNIYNTYNLGEAQKTFNPEED